MPVVGYYNSQGDLLAQATATVIASKGTYIEAPTPSLKGVTLGTYAGLVANKTSTGALDYLGAASVYVGYPPPPPPPTKCGAAVPALAKDSKALPNNVPVCPPE
jgi:hypothetical protein